MPEDGANALRASVALPSGLTATVEVSPAYDLLFSLDLLAHRVRTGPWRAWLAETPGTMTVDHWQRIRRWFGGEAHLGGAYAALIPTLPGPPDVAAFLDGLARMPVADFLRVAVTAGLADPAAPVAAERLLSLAEDATLASAYVDRYFAFSGTQRAHLLRLLADPRAARDDLVALLQRYAEQTFATLEPHLGPERERAGARLLELLRTQPEDVLPDEEKSLELRGFSPIVFTPCGFTETARAAYLHEIDQPLFDGTAYEPVILFMNTAHLLGRATPRPSGALLPQRLSPPERWATLFAALADASRLRMVRLLRERPRYGQELAKLLDSSAATVSHHVNALTRAGLIRMERHAHRTYYRLREDRLAELLAEGSDFLLQDDVTPETEDHQ